MPALLLLLEAAPQTASQPAAINHGCPLIVAAKYGRTEAVQLLLQLAPSSVTSTSLNGRTAAHLAAERNQADTLRQLLTAAPGLARAVSLLTESTPLRSAARQGATDALQVLLAVAPEAADAADLAGAAAVVVGVSICLIKWWYVQAYGELCRKGEAWVEPWRFSSALSPPCRHAASSRCRVQRPCCRCAAAAGRCTAHRVVHQLCRPDSPAVSTKGSSAT